MKHASFATCLLLALCACGDDAPDSGDAAALDASSDSASTSDGNADRALADASLDAALDPLPQDAFASSFAAAFCEAARPCCERVTTMKADCVPAVTTQVAELLDGLDEKAMYDPALAASCVAALEASPKDCVAAFEARHKFWGPCQLAINGTLSPGEECASLAECAAQPGAIGNRIYGFVGCLPFDDAKTHCRHFSPVGLNETCSATVTGGSEGTIDSCMPGLFCDEESSTCKPLPDVGAQCMNVGSSGPCSEGFCDSETNECTALLPEGDDCQNNALSCDPCGGHSSCEERFTCQEGTCALDNLVRYFGVSFGHIVSISPNAACDV